MKRFTYISHQAQALSDEEISQIGSISSENNRRDGITGVLIYVGGLFFQIIEGEEAAVDRLYAKIFNDPRHNNVLCLKSEHEVATRLFPQWLMKTINLDQNTDELVYPIKILLQTLTQSHRIIERYTQPAVLAILNQGLNPLDAPAQTVERIILFSDIIAFSRLSETHSVVEVVAFVNQFLDICSRHITDQGGEVTKYIGDCVMAYFWPSQADQALQGCLNILAELTHIRQSASPGSLLSNLRCGFGLTQGIVAEGNIGSRIKMNYTILGDAVNTASRLESLTRQLPYSILFSAQIRRSARRNWEFVPLGDHALKGKDKFIEVYSLREAESTNF